MTAQEIAEIDRLLPFVSKLGTESDNPEEFTFLIPSGLGPTREMCKRLFERYASENATDDEYDERVVLKVIFKTTELKNYFEGQKGQP